MYQPCKFNKLYVILLYQILAQLDCIDDIKRHQKEYCVPITVCQHLEQCIKETEVR